MHRLDSRGARGTCFLTAVVAVAMLAVPVSSTAQLPTASVTVCQVSAGASVPGFVEVQVSVDQLAAWLALHPGSFVGACPASGGGSGSTSPPLSGAVTVCRVSGSANAPLRSEVIVAAEEVAAFLNQNPGSFVGSCPPSTGGGNASSGGGTGPLNAVVTVCRVTGDARAARVAQLTLEVNEVAAFLNRNPGSFIGTCPGSGGTVTNGPGRILGLPAGAALSICGVTGSARAARLTQVNVAVDRVAAFLNQNPGSFVGLCPSSGDPNGTLGNEPLGYVTICRVTGDARTPLAPITIRREGLEVYLTRAGTVVPAPTGGCPAVQDRDGGGAPPTTATAGRPSTVVVETSPNTVVTASGAGVEEKTRSDKKGKAKVKIKPKRKGIVTVRGEGGGVVTRVGVAGATQSGSNLTG
jgi:hypothetical protein